MGEDKIQKIHWKIDHLSLYQLNVKHPYDSISRLIFTSSINRQCCPLPAGPNPLPFRPIPLPARRERLLFLDLSDCQSHELRLNIEPNGLNYINKPFQSRTAIQRPSGAPGASRAPDRNVPTSFSIVRNSSTADG